MNITLMTRQAFILILLEMRPDANFVLKTHIHNLFPEVVLARYGNMVG